MPDKNTGYELTALPLDGGLDFLTPASYALSDGQGAGRQGSLIDCLNVEIVDRAGYKPIDGYSPYDGAWEPLGIEDIFVVKATAPTVITNFSSLTSGMYLYRYSMAGLAVVIPTPIQPFGVVLYAYGPVTVEGVTDNYYIFYKRLSKDAEADPATGIAPGVTSSTNSRISGGGITLGNSLTDYFDDNGRDYISDATGGTFTGSPAGFLSWLVNVYNSPSAEHLLTLKTKFQEVSSGARIPQASLITTFKDNDYLIGDTILIDFEQGGLTDGLEIKPGTTLTVPSASLAGGVATYSSDEFVVLKITTTGGSWAGGTASGTASVVSKIRKIRYAQPYAGGVEPSVMQYGSPTLSSTYITYPFTASRDVDNVAALVVTGISTAVRATTEPAALFKACNETQAVADADRASTVGRCGWEWEETGYNLNFNKGFHSAGFLNKVKRTQETQVTTSATVTTDLDDNYGAGVVDAAIGALIGRPRKVLGWMDFPGAFNQTKSRWQGSDSATVVPLAPALVATSGDSDYVFANTQRYIAEGVGGATSDTLGFFSFAYMDDETIVTGTTTRGVPRHATIKGITFTVNVGTSAGWSSTAKVDFFRMKANLVRTSNVNDPDQLFGSNRAETRLGDYRQADLTISNAAMTQTITFGSATDMWGNATLTRDEVTAENFGIALSYEYQVNAAANNELIDVYIDKIQIQITYELGSIKYFFTDSVGAPTKILSGELVNYELSGGSFTSADAQGIMHLANVTIESGNQSCILSGYTIHSANPPTTANQVGVATADMEFNGFPNSAAIKTQGSRYEVITANFYSDDRYEGLYLVSGAGRAFAYDGTYCSPIYAIALTEDEADEKDLPRHIAFHHGHLVLGYDAGVCLTSVIGDPENFNAVEGAGLITTGDSITGLSNLQGTTLGMFCKNSIWSLSGTSVGNFSTQIISPSSGCIEYTLQNIGNMPIFCDNRGVSSLNQSQRYGDFTGNRLSHRVTPWLRPRLTRALNAVGVAALNGIICTSVSRSKNQYLVWFRDGYVLCLSFVGPEMEPQFTIRKYGVPNPATDRATNYPLLDTTFVPACITSNTTKQGQERILMSMDTSMLGSSYTDPYPSSALELDKSFTFGGASIGEGTVAGTVPTCYATVGWLTLGDPFSHKTIKKIRIESICKEAGQVIVRIYRDYAMRSGVDPGTDPITNASGIVFLLPETGSPSGGGIPFDYYPEATIKTCNSTARTFALQLQFVPSPTVEPVGWGTPTPPMFAQMLLIQYEKGRPDA